MVSMLRAVPLMRIGSRPPRAVPPSARRLNQMFGHAVKRCQATPMVRLRAITISQIIADTILMVAMT